MTNKSARIQLEKIFGKECMFKRAEIAERIEQLGGIKTYKTFIRETRYRERKIKLLRKILTYHHLVHLSEGGKTTIKNGAILSVLAHRYIHSLPREQEEIINNWLRQFKSEFMLSAGILIPTEQGIEIVKPITIDLDMNFDDTDCIIIPVYDTTEEDLKKFKRAKEKRTAQKIIEEGMQDYYEIDD